MGLKGDDRCLARVADDEPIFVLRAQDRLAPLMVRAWLTLAQASLGQEHYDEALLCLAQMEAWQQDHGSKLPD